MIDENGEYVRTFEAQRMLWQGVDIGRAGAGEEGGA